MVLAELFGLLTGFMYGEIDELDTRICLSELPSAEEVIYAQSILDNQMRLVAYLDYLQALIYHMDRNSDDSDDNI